MTWKRLAKDGADLPPAQAIRGRSAQQLSVGETYDFELTPKPGRYRLVAEFREKPLWTRELVARNLEEPRPAHPKTSRPFQVS